MPIANLLLVFCPSLSMSPTLLRALCEAKNIWNGPSEGHLSPVVLEIARKEAGVTEDESDPSDPPEDEAGVDPSDESQEPASSNVIDDNKTSRSFDAPATARPRLGRAANRDDPIATVYLTASDTSFGDTRTSVLTVQDDTASYVSALDNPSSGTSRSSTPNYDSPSAPPALSSSTDSLATPSTMSEDPSFTQASPTVDNSFEKPEPERANSPMIANPSDMALPSSPRRPAISSPIPFPSSGGSVPNSPIKRRKSSNILSFPPLRSENNSGGSSIASWTRSKRPSLTLLFTKKSSSALNSPVIHTAPSSAVKLSETVPAVNPPQLDTVIPSSPIRLGFDDEQSSPQSPIMRTAKSAPELLSVAQSHLHIRTDSVTTSLYSTPQQTPILDQFRSHTPLTTTLNIEENCSKGASVNVFPTNPSQVSLSPSLNVNIETSAEDNWMQSVLLASG